MMLKWIVIIIFTCYGIITLFYWANFANYKNTIQKYVPSFIGFNYGTFEVLKIFKAYNIARNKSNRDKRILKNALLQLIVLISIFGATFLIILVLISIRLWF